MVILTKLIQVAGFNLINRSFLCFFPTLISCGDIANPVILFFSFPFIVNLH